MEAGMKCSLKANISGGASGRTCVSCPGTDIALIKIVYC